MGESTRVEACPIVYGHTASSSVGDPLTEWPTFLIESKPLPATNSPKREHRLPIFVRCAPRIEIQKKPCQRAAKGLGLSRRSGVRASQARESPSTQAAP